jgi:hypothetical protein
MHPYQLPKLIDKVVLPIHSKHRYVYQYRCTSKNRLSIVQHPLAIMQNRSQVLDVLDPVVWLRTNTKIVEIIPFK